MNQLSSPDYLNIMFRILILSSAHHYLSYFVSSSNSLHLFVSIAVSFKEMGNDILNLRYFHDLSSTP